MYGMPTLWRQNYVILISGLQKSVLLAIIMYLVIFYNQYPSFKRKRDGRMLPKTTEKKLDLLELTEGQRLIGPDWILQQDDTYSENSELYRIIKWTVDLI